MHYANVRHHLLWVRSLLSLSLSLSLSCELWGRYVGMNGKIRIKLQSIKTKQIKKKENRSGMLELGFDLRINKRSIMNMFFLLLKLINFGR